MTVNEFKKMEEYLRNLEALRSYPQVKEERDFLSIETGQLKKKADQLEAKLKTQTQANSELSSALTKIRAEAKELTGKLSEVQNELLSLREFKVKFPGAGELTLAEMKSQFLQVEKDEIEKNVKERLAELEKNLQNRMPAMVYERLIEVLKSDEWPPEITELIDATARKLADGTLGDRDRWPDWFRDYYLVEVNSLVNGCLTAEFQRRVEVEAEERLQLMKAGQWEEFITSKVRMLTISLKSSIKELEGPWLFTCDRCGRKATANIGPSDIGLLLRGEVKDIVCSMCSDPDSFPFILSTVQHKIFSLNLGTLLERYIDTNPQ